MLGQGIAPLVPLLSFVIVSQKERLWVSFIQILLAVVPLTVIMLLAGWSAGWACGLGPGVAVTVLGRGELAVFRTAYFLDQVPILIVMTSSHRKTVTSSDAQRRPDHERARYATRAAE